MSRKGRPKISFNWDKLTIREAYLAGLLIQSTEKHKQSCKCAACVYSNFIEINVQVLT